MDERVEVARLDGELLEVLGQGACRRPCCGRSRSATRTASCSRPTSAKRSKAPRSCAVRSALCLASNHHSTSFVATMPRQPSLSPSSTYAPRTAAIAAVGELGERGERLVAAIELVGEDVGELAASAR